MDILINSFPLILFFIRWYTMSRKHLNSVINYSSVSHKILEVEFFNMLRFVKEWNMFVVTYDNNKLPDCSSLKFCMGIKV